MILKKTLSDIGLATDEQATTLLPDASIKTQVGFTGKVDDINREVHTYYESEKEEYNIVLNAELA